MAAVIGWMNAKGWLTDGERELLFTLAQQVPADGVIVNLGVEFGASLACLRAGNADCRIYGLDIDMSKVLENGYGCTLFENDSHKVIKDWNSPIDLLFVDGDHGYDGVLLDAQYAEWLVVGGYVLFQDCFDWSDFTSPHTLVPGVNLAVTEWFKTAKGEFEELPSVGTTRVFRRVKEHVTGSGSVNTNLQPGAAAGGKPGLPASKPVLQRPAKAGNRRR